MPQIKVLVMWVKQMQYEVGGGRTTGTPQAGQLSYMQSWAEFAFETICFQWDSDKEYTVTVLVIRF